MPPNLVLDTPATRSAETQPAISSVNSDIRSKGRWTRMIHHLNIGGERATDAASAPSNRETNTVSLQATVLNSARSPVPLDSTSSNRRGIRWHNVLASPSPVEGGELPNQMDVIARSRTPDSGVQVPSMPAILDSHRSPTPLRRVPTPIVIPRVGHHQVQAYNPDLTAIISPGGTLFESPTTVTSEFERRSQSSPNFIREPTPFDATFRGLASLDFLASYSFSHVREQTQSTMDSWKTAPLYVERKLLIIGSNYREANRRASTQLSVASATYEPLSGTENDVRDLRSTFQGRGYSVQTMTQEAFSRVDVLDRVAMFLSTASPGDVRAIVFTGHSHKYDTSPAMIPPISPSNTIGADDWNQNIRSHAKPGVIVLSIIATCFSGGFAEQGVRITDFNHAQGVQDGLSPDVPIYITFSSSGAHETAYESSLGSYEPQCRDHFLWALAGTARDPEVRNWHNFVETLRERFAYARVKGAEGLREGTLPWLCQHRQHPEFIVARPGRFPAWHSIFPTVP